MKPKLFAWGPAEDTRFWARVDSLLGANTPRIVEDSVSITTIHGARFERLSFEAWKVFDEFRDFGGDLFIVTPTGDFWHRAFYPSAATLASFHDIHFCTPETAPKFFDALDLAAFDREVLTPSPATPFGYCETEDGVEVDGARGAVVQELYAFVQRGFSHVQAVKMVAKSWVYEDAGRPRITVATVKAILRDRRYRGAMGFPALISGSLRPVGSPGAKLAKKRLEVAGV